MPEKEFNGFHEESTAIILESLGELYTALGFSYMSQFETLEKEGKFIALGQMTKDLEEKSKKIQEAIKYIKEPAGVHLMEEAEHELHLRTIKTALQFSLSELKKINESNSSKKKINEVNQVLNLETIKGVEEDRSLLPLEEVEEKKVTEGNKIFLMFSGQDAELAEAFYEFIEEDIGIPCFFSKEKPERSKQFPIKLNDHMENSRVVLCLATKNVNEAGWIKFELGLRTAHKKGIIPLVFCDPKNFDSVINYLTYEDCYNFKNFEGNKKEEWIKELKKLVKELNKIFGLNKSPDEVNYDKLIESISKYSRQKKKLK